MSGGSKNATFVLGQRGVADTVHLGVPRSSGSGLLRQQQQAQVRRSGGFGGAAAGAASATFDNADSGPAPRARPQQQAATERHGYPRAQAQQPPRGILRPSALQQRFTGGVPAPRPPAGGAGAPPERPPSVTFSELDAFANPAKLRTAEQMEETRQQQQQQYVVEEEEEGDFSDDDDDLDDLDEQGALDKAARLANEVQADNDFAFMQQQRGESGGGASGRRRVSFGPNDYNEAPDDYGDNEGDDSFGGFGQASHGRPPAGRGAPPGASEYDHLFGGETAAQTRERIRLIAKLKRKNAKKDPSERVEIDEGAPLEVLRRMTIGTNYETKAQLTVLMLRRVIVFGAKLIEGLSTRFPKYFGDLEGWSENLYMSLDQYEDLLYDVYDMYLDDVQTNPLVTLIFALGSNAAMYAVAKKLVNNPATGQVLSGLAQAFQQRAGAGAGGPIRVSGGAPPPDPNNGPAAPPRRGGEGPAAPMSASSADTLASGPLGAIASMFSGSGGADLNSILSSIGDVLGGGGGGANLSRSSDVEVLPDTDDIEDYGPDPSVPRDLRGEPIPLVRVDAMSEPEDAAALMRSLRMEQDSAEYDRVEEQQQQQQLASIPEDDELQPGGAAETNEGDDAPGVRLVEDVAPASAPQRRRKSGAVKLG